jgi:Transposase DDE domain
LATTLADLADALQTVFTTEAADAAHAAGLFRRRRKLSGPTFVQALTFGWLANPHASLGELAELAADLGADVSPQALDQRFTPQAVDCLSAVLHAALLRLVQADPVAADLLDRFGGIYARDSSTITLPGDLAGAWPGNGHGQPSIPCAAAKLHLGVELTTGALEGLSLQPGKTSDRCCVGTHAPLPEGALLLEDLGFFDMVRLRHYDALGAFVLSRAPARLLVRPEGGRSQRVGPFLAGQTADRVDVAVTLGRRHKAWRCRLIAVRVPAEVERQRRERIIRETKNMGRTVSAERLALCAWTVLLTNAPASLLSVEEALALRRLRWQIELLFRVWKDEGKIDEWRGHKPYRVLCELLAKLLGQVVQHWATLLAGSPLEISAVKAAQRVRPRAARLAQSLGELAALVAVLGRLRERLRRFAVKRGRPGRPTTLEIVRAPGRYGWPVPPAGAQGAPDRQRDARSGPPVPEKRAEAA